MKKKTVQHIVLFASVLTIALIAFFVIKGKSAQISNTNSPFHNYQSKWADSVFQSMSYKEKIEQLLIADMPQSLDFATITQLKQHSFGGIIYNGDSLINNITAANTLQNNLKIPLFLSNNNKQIIRDFQEKAYLLSEQELLCLSNHQLFMDYISWKNEFQSLGFNLGFLREFNAHFKNNYFGDTNFTKVFTQRLLLQTSAKQHIPNVTSLDGILMGRTVPINKFNSYFSTARYLAQSGLIAVHFDTAIDEFNVKILRDTILFNGLIMARLHQPDAENIAQQFQQGADMLIVNALPDKLIQIIQKITAQKTIDENIVNSKVKKILLTKAWLNINNPKIQNTDEILDSLNIPKNIATVRNTALQSHLILNNSKKIIPLQSLKNIGFFSYDTCRYSQFRKYFQYYSSFRNYTLSGIGKETKELEKIFNTHQTIIFAVSQNYTKNELTEKLEELIAKFQQDKNIILIHFNNSDALQQWPVLPTTLQMHRLHPLTEQYAAQLICGGLTTKGFNAQLLNLPTITSIDTTATKIRLAYVIPEEVNIQSRYLKIIDSIIAEGIRAHAMPGCQLWVAKNGKVFLHESYGRTTYSGNAVDWNTMYDVASVTKIAATTLAAMKMVELNKINLNQRIGRYFKNTNIDYKRIKPDTTIIRDTFFFDEIIDMKKIVSELDTFHLNDSMFVAFDTVVNTVTPRTNIFNLTFKELLIHQSGISPSLPIVKYLKFKNDTINNFNTYFSKKYIKDSATIPIAENLYFRNRFMDTLWSDIKQMKVSSRKKFQYSDANMVLLQMTFDTINRMRINQYLYRTFYDPLNLLNISFNPAKNNLPKYRIAPTERDEYWRSQILQGYVHDPTAAILGGIAGNAGLFSNANDLGVLFQMILNGGTYGGIRFINYQTIKTFISQQAESHRGLGFDRPSRKTIIAPSASKNSYGHTGFTGSCVWVDPDEKLVFIILTNRVHPSAKNWTYNKLKIRERVHQAIYNAIKQSKTNNKVTPKSNA